MTLAARTASLFALAAGVVAITAFRVDVSYDLGSLLPTARTLGQQVLKERLGMGPGAQVIYAVLPDANPATAADTAEGLRQIPSVRRVLPQANGPGVETVPAELWRSQFSLTDLPTDRDGWHEVLESRLSDIAIADDDLTGLIAADPMFATVGTLTDLMGEPPRYSHPDGQYLIILTTVPAFDAEGQSRLVRAIRATMVQSGATNAQLYGNGVYTADLQATVRLEAALFSLVAGCGLICLLLWYFRSGVVLAAIAAPMLTGAAAGFCAVSLMFDVIHGVGLAFGFTLLGVAVDYPLHIFSHRDRPRSVWPTLRISIASTLIAYGVFLFGGSSALSQLGTFAIFGVSAAALATKWLIPQSPRPGTKRLATIDASATTARNQLSNLPWVMGLVVVTPLILFRPSFSDDLGTLTPVAPDIIAADAELRERLGASDMRHLIAVQANELELVLQRTEAVAKHLDGVAASRALAGYSHVAQLLPSRRTQLRRHSAVRQFVADGGTSPGTAFAMAADDLGYSPSAFRPFDERARAASAALEITTRDAIQDADLAAFVDTHLYVVGDVWKSLVFLRGISDIRMIESALSDLPAELVDLKSASSSLVVDFRYRLLQVLGISLFVIAVAVYLLTRNIARTIWVLGTVVTALVVAASSTAYLRGGITPFDLMSLALVAGLGLDYGLFFSKQPRGRQDASNTARAVLICALSSLLVFGILSFSSIPVLSGIGGTVAIGVLTAYVLARFGRSGRATATVQH